MTQHGGTNKTVHVTDSLGGDLGTVTATDEPPFAKGTFTYSARLRGVAGTCTELQQHGHDHRDQASPPARPSRSAWART